MKLTLLQKTVLMVCVLLLISGSLLSDASAAPTAERDPYIAVTIKVTADVYLRRSDKEELVPLKMDTRLFPGDRIICGEHGTASLVFTDTAVELKLFPNSDMTLQGIRTQDNIVKRIFLPIGKLFSKVFSGNLEVVTPTSVASVKGTEWWTLVESADVTRFIVIDGVVEVKHRETDQIMTVESGYSGTSSSGGDLEVVKTQGKDIPTLDETILRETLDIEFMNDQQDTTKLHIEFE